MGRKDFTLLTDVAVAELLLDVSNPRIRSGYDQNDCITRILRKEEQLINLAKNIQEEGLSTAPILVYQEDNGKLSVMDGNRRVTALKLLNNPDLCPDARLRKVFAGIRSKGTENIPAEVDCLASQNMEAIIGEILLRHSGERGGIGQVDWTTYLRTSFMLQHHQSDPNRRAGQYLLWAETRGVLINDDFPVTNLVRFITEATLRKLGFAIQNDELVPILPVDVCQRMASKIIYDFGFGSKTVDDIRRPEQQDAYIQEVRAQAGLKDDGPKGDENPGKGANGVNTGGSAGGGSAGEGNGQSQPNPNGGQGKQGDGGNGAAGGGADQEGGNKGAGAAGGNSSGGKSNNGGSRPKAPWDRARSLSDYWRERNIFC